MEPASRGCGWSRAAAVAVIGSALLLLGCDGPFPGVDPDTRGPQSMEPLDGSIGDGEVDEADVGDACDPQVCPSQCR